MRCCASPSPAAHWPTARALQVLVNLLTNAIQYNRPGGEVRVSGRSDGASVTLSVVDSGRGMSGAQLERLFEPFDRLAPSARASRAPASA